MPKRNLVIAAIGFATAFAGTGAMAAGSNRVVSQGSVRFHVDSATQYPVSQGARMSAGQKKQWMLVPAVQVVREKAARGNSGT